jgi:hypothetical protein
MPAIVLNVRPHNTSTNNFAGTYEWDESRGAVAEKTSRKERRIWREEEEEDVKGIQDNQDGIDH